MSVCCHGVYSNSGFENVRLEEWKRRRVDTLLAHGCGTCLLGTPSNVLSSSGLGCLPEWHLQYRVAKDGLAYHREEFKEFYMERFRFEWNEAKEATEKQKHVALLSVLRLRTDQLRMSKVADALRCFTCFDDAIIDNIANFVSPGTRSGESQSG